MRGGEPAAPAPGVAAARVHHDERHADQLRVQRDRALPGHAVVAQVDAVVGHEHDDRVALEPQGVEPVEEDAEPAVGHRHLGRVERPHAFEQQLARGPAEVARHLRVVRLGRLRPAVVRVAVHVHVAARRRPGLVRLERVDHEGEGALLRGRLEHAGGLAKHARRVGARFVVEVACVAEELAHPQPGLGIVDLGRQPAAQLGLRNAGPGAAGLARLRHEAVEALPERRIGAREADERVVADAAGPVARPAQQAGEGQRGVGDRLPAGLLDHAAPGAPARERESAATGHDRPARGHGGHRLGVAAGEAEPAAGEGVDVGRAGAVAVDVVGAERVHHDQDDVGAVAAALRDFQPRHERQARRSQELTAGGGHAGQTKRWGGG